MSEPTEPTDPIRSALELELVVSRAAVLARTGDLDEAARLLTEAGTDAGGPVAVAALDVLARVYAQRGDLAAADECWARAQDLAPDDPAAAEGRRTVQAITAGRRPARPRVHSGWLAVVAAGLAVTLVASGGVWLATSGPFAEGSPGPASAGPLVAAAERTGAEARRAAAQEQRLASEVRRSDSLAQQLAKLEAGRVARAGRHERALADLTRRLAMPGVRVRRQGEDVQVLFETGVFARGTEIRPGSADLLAELGRRLRPLRAETTVVGHSVTVPGGARSGGSTVALGRAQVAARYLAAGGELPLTAFALVSGDQSARPFPDRVRNRTVSLLVRPKL